MAPNLEFPGIVKIVSKYQTYATFCYAGVSLLRLFQNLGTDVRRGYALNVTVSRYVGKPGDFQPVMTSLTLFENIFASTS